MVSGTHYSPRHVINLSSRQLAKTARLRRRAMSSGRDTQDQRYAATSLLRRNRRRIPSGEQNLWSVGRAAEQIDR